MPDQRQLSLFALDCGATNWRLYRSEYRPGDSAPELLGAPQPSPLTSFVDRRLPAVICLDPAGSALESFGEAAQGQLENESLRERVRDHFKPCIGAHLEENPLPHQKRHTHAQALEYTRLLLKAVLDQLRQEKWRSSVFDDRVVFTFAYPLHWRQDHESRGYEEFVRMVRGCFPEGFDGLRFVAEPEGAILSLAHNRLLAGEPGREVVLIIDVGGSTTDLLAGRVAPGCERLEFLGRHGAAFGGGLYDAELAGMIADELKVPASALASDPSAMLSLRVSAQRLKESLSRQLLAGQLKHVPQRAVTLVMRDGTVYRRSIALDEARFQEATSRLDGQFSTLIDTALEVMHLQESGIGQVLLVGGGAQLFTLVRHLRQRFSPGKVLLAENPEEIVVQGLGLEYGAALRQVEPTIHFPAQPGPANGEGTPAPQTGAWSLVAADGLSLRLPQGLTTVGRGAGSGLQMIEPKVSRLHAELRVSAQGLELVDMGSSNGTWVNGVRLGARQAQALQPGDEIIFGRSRFTCVLETVP